MLSDALFVATNLAADYVAANVVAAAKMNRPVNFVGLAIFDRRHPNPESVRRHFLSFSLR